MNQQQIHTRVRELDQIVEEASGVEFKRQIDERKAIYQQCDQIGHVLSQHPIYPGCVRCAVCGWDNTNQGRYSPLPG
jgi:hypothetical protein